MKWRLKQRDRKRLRLDPTERGGNQNPIDDSMKLLVIHSRFKLNCELNRSWTGKNLSRAL